MSIVYRKAVPEDTVAWTGEIAVLALLPNHEGHGIGKALLARMVEEFSAAGFRRLFLGCSPEPSVRSHGFYRHLGWTSTGTFDGAGDEILEFLLAQRTQQQVTAHSACLSTLPTSQTS